MNPIINIRNIREVYMTDCDEDGIDFDQTEFKEFMEFMEFLEIDFYNRCISQADKGCSGWPRVMDVDGR